MIRSKVIKIVELLQQRSYHTEVSPDGIVYLFFTPKGSEFKLKDTGCEWKAYDHYTGEYEDCFTIAENKALTDAVKDHQFTSKQNNAFDRLMI